MNKKQKKMLIRIIIAGVLMIGFKILSAFVDIPTVILFIMYMVPYLVMALIYIVLVLIISFAIKLMERSLRRSDRRN